ncbi:hypothetical protein Tco_0999964, partial [Tanacetum coccineum]
TLIEIRSARPKAKGIAFRESGESTTITTPTPIPSKIQDKGKAKMIEPEKPLKKKNQIMFDEEVTLKLQAELQAELEEEEKLVRQREEEANIALWDNVQAMMDDDYQMAQQLQAEEQEKLSIEEKSKLFTQLLEARKKHFAALRAKEKRNKPLTKAQKRNTILKRARDELQQESSKKQKVDDDKENEELKQCFEIVLEDEDTVDVIPLAVKPAPIVDWKINKEDKKSYYQIMRADGSF